MENITRQNQKYTDFKLTMDNFILSHLHHHREPLVISKNVRQFLLQYCRTVMENKILGKAMTKQTLPSLTFPVTPIIIFVSLYKYNKLLACTFKQGKDFLDTVKASTLYAIKLAELDKNIKDIHVEINLLFNETILTKAAFLHEFHLGIDSLCLTYQQHMAIFKNSVPIRYGYSTRETLSKLFNKLNTPRLVKENCQISIFKTIEFREDFLSKKNPHGLYDLFRARPLILPSEVTIKNIKQALRLVAKVFARFITKAGHIHYEYNYQKQAFINQDTAVSHLRKLATLHVYANLLHYQHNDTQLISLEKIIYIYIEKYYQENASGGFLKINSIIDLGTSSCFFLAMHALKQENFLIPIKNNLITFIKNNFDFKGGKFTPIILPKSSVAHAEAELFFPLLAIIALLEYNETDADPLLLEIAEVAFNYYANLFKKNNNKIKMLLWMNRAYSQLYLLTKNKCYSNFILLATDNILSLQILNDPINIDNIGSFSPCGNSRTTAVMTECLLYAYQIALAVYDTVRAEGYYQRILLALRFLLQAQITKEDKLNSKLIGAFKNNLYDPSTRIDTLQHITQALLMFLKLPKPPL